MHLQMLCFARFIYCDFYSQSSKIIGSFYFTRMSTSVKLVSKVIVNIENEGQKRVSHTNIDDNTAPEAKIIKVDSERIKRKPYAIMLGYLGKDYYGMQRNPGMKTIEEDLINSLFRANLITQEAFDCIQTINFQRAARTDKGVSACRQIVSLKLPEPINIKQLNYYLPEEIRIFGAKRVTKGFNSKNKCDARTYLYIIPTYAFVQNSFISNDDFTDEQKIENLSIINGKPCTEYRISEEKLDTLKRIMKLFEGSHNFHNFTYKVKPLDPSARRYIIEFSISDVFLNDNVEFAVLKIKGQSFMLHQIRKMVGLVIGILRSMVSEDVMQEVFQLNKFEIPMAPSLGLVLNYVHYDNYNKRYGNDGMHEKLEWKECEAEVDEFFKNSILNYIIKTELSEKQILNWIMNVEENYTFKIEEKAKSN
ncbi:pseudouridylate synthase 1 homolog [Prorops nasuta]|uniref:pseudouridylate synthase 1 homolog n=1 Tax=Prorops nasuta TaxID=863751 RepID=UPI0034CF02AE